MFVDSHCHINAADFDEDRENAVLRAREVGVDVIMDVCDDLADVEQLTEFCAQHKNIYTTAGVHPEIADKYVNLTVEELINKTASPYVVGIGECGLDYFYNNDIKTQQLEVFQKHITAAQETELPLIIHSRDADEDMMTILQEAYAKKKFRGEMHCFSSSPRLAEFALSIGFYISASGIITFKKSQELRDVFAQIPVSRLLIETDSPFLAPVPYRGKRNEPAFVVHTASVLAEIKGVNVAEIADITTSNFYNLFSKVKKD